MKFPRVKEILNEFDKSGINGVFKYLIQPDMVIDPSTWSGKLLEDIRNKNIYTAMSKIELIGYKFSKTNKNNGEEDGKETNKPVGLYRYRMPHSFVPYRGRNYNFL